MATNRDLLKEAIADAKAVKETAIANAKAALTESFTPFLREKLSEKIQAMDEEDDNDTYMDEMVYDEAKMENEGLDEISLDELLAELEENDSEMEENLYEAKEEEEMEEDEEMSIEDMSEDDLKSFIEDVIKDMVAAGELSADEEEHEAAESEEEEKAEHEEGGSEEGEEAEEVEEELDLEELLAEIELEEKHSYTKKAKDSTPKSKNAIFHIHKGKDEYVTDKTEEDDAPLSAKNAEKLSFHENKLEEDEVNEFGSVLGQMVSDGTAIQIISSVLGVTAAIAANIWKDEIKDKVKNTKDFLKSLLNRKETSTKEEPEVKDAEIEELKSELNEINLLNAKLLYTNKIFRSKSLSESQKIKVLTAFDKAKNKKEAQLVYETLLESLKVPSIGAKTSIKESLGSASKSLGSANAKPIIDVDNQFARWQTLAGINKK